MYCAPLALLPSAGAGGGGRRRRCGSDAVRERARLSLRARGPTRILRPPRGPGTVLHLRAPLALPWASLVQSGHPGATEREGAAVPEVMGWAGGLVHPSDGGLAPSAFSSRMGLKYRRIL